MKKITKNELKIMSESEFKALLDGIHGTSSLREIEQKISKIKKQVIASHQHKIQQIEKKIMALQVKLIMVNAEIAPKLEDIHKKQEAVRAVLAIMRKESIQEG